MYILKIVLIESRVSNNSNELFFTTNQIVLESTNKAKVFQVTQTAGKNRYFGSFLRKKFLPYRMKFFFCFTSISLSQQ